ncbi:hypothetical protein [Thalassotalea sp. SU-HH00458]|uniref:hypothetical protein n=1 Tax=Thalassotalea sp. SU-HH00458 TaxID=3127657 RepID=UPI003104C912
MKVEVSKLRINILRTVYLLIVVVFGYRIWPTIINPNEVWDPLQGVAFSFWGAFTLLSILGVWQPLKMLPLLFMQLTYKVIWMLAVGLQLWSAGQIGPVAAGLIRSNSIGIIIDLLVIPWPYVWSTYILKTNPNNHHSYSDK